MDDPVDKDRESPGAESEEDIPISNEQLVPSARVTGHKHNNCVKEANIVKQKQPARCAKIERITAQPALKNNSESPVYGQKNKECFRVQTALKNNVENRRNQCPHGNSIDQSPPKNQTMSPSKPQNQNRPPPQTQQTSNSNKKQKPRPVSSQNVTSVNHSTMKPSLNTGGDSNKENGGHRREQESACKKLLSKKTESKEKQQRLPVQQVQHTSQPQQDDQNLETTQQSPARKNRQGKKKKKTSLGEIFV